MESASTLHPSSLPPPKKEKMSVASKCKESASPTKQDGELILSTLPQESGWRIAEAQLSKYQGIWYPSVLLPGLISAQENFKPLPNDIVLCSIPKSGTTWLKALAFAIVTRNVVFDDSTTNPLLTKVPHDLVPHLEIHLTNSNDHRDPKIPVLATHAPYNSLPKSILDSSDCKIIYICRDSKDELVSLWNFVNTVMLSRTRVEEGKQRMPAELFSLDEAFELYHTGVSPYGPRWDHGLGYWQASLEWPEKVLFVKYEDLKNDPMVHVKRMAKFMGYPFSLEEERKGMVENIVNMCGFENLSNLEVNKNGTFCIGEAHVLENKAFFGKGKVGDWINYLTAEMAEKLDQITCEKFGSCSLQV